MGTRSSYRFVEKSTKTKKSKIYANVYFQYDGYPEGHPLEAANWLNNGEVVNGFSLKNETLQFNGIGCLIAQFIAKFKTGIGNVYFEPIENWGNCGEDYIYEIEVIDNSKIVFTAFAYNWEKSKFEKIFKGSPKQFCEKITFYLQNKNLSNVH